MNVRIIRHNFVGDKAKIRRRAVALQGFLTQSPAKFDEKTCMNPYVYRFLLQRKKRTHCKEKTALTRVRLHLICSLTMNRIASELLRSHHGLSSITEILFNPLRRKIVCRYLRRTERVSMIKIYFKEGAEIRSMLMGGVTLWKIFPLFPDKISYPMHYGS